VTPKRHLLKGRSVQVASFWGDFSRRRKRVVVVRRELAGPMSPFFFFQISLRAGLDISENGLKLKRRHV
jgi:hypothetical protein